MGAADEAAKAAEGAEGVEDAGKEGFATKEPKMIIALQKNENLQPIPFLEGILLQGNYEFGCDLTKKVVREGTI